MPELGALRDWRERIGQRVVIRRSEADGRLSDVLGVLREVQGESARDAVLVVLRESRGEVTPVRIPLGEVVIGKPVPPRPSRKGPPHLALGVSQLAWVVGQDWQPPDTERLGDWLLRAAGGVTHRANSALPVGDPGRPLPEALDGVRAWYAERGLPARLLVPRGPEFASLVEVLHSPGAALGATGADRPAWGVVPTASACVLTAPTGELRAPIVLPAGFEITRADQADGDWAAAWGTSRGDEFDAALLQRLLNTAGAQLCAAVRERATGRIAGIARGTIAAGWAGLSSVHVVPEHRRRGLARALLATVAEWAWQHGAGSTWLQVLQANARAQQLYSAAGFTLHHRYDYWSPVPTG